MEIIGGLYINHNMHGMVPGTQCNNKTVEVKKNTLQLDLRSSVGYK